MAKQNCFANDDIDDDNFAVAMVPALYCIVYGVTTSFRRVVLLYQ
jgi:hypothetical protein